MINIIERKMKTVLIAGSTGMIGNLVLRFALASEEIDKVIVINRRNLGFTHPKLTEVIHKDFEDFSKISKYFKDINIAYYCVGVYTGAVSREEFRKITIDYTKYFADELEKNSPQSTFCFLSGEGADRTEKSRMAFAKDKGIAENYLLNKKFPSILIFRPGYIYPVTPRVEPNFSYKISRKLYPLLKLVYNNGIITSEELAKVIFERGLNCKNKKTFRNKDMKLLN